MAHLNYEILLNYIKGQLSVEERSAADVHLGEPCDLCQRRLVLLQTVLRSASGDQSTPPPASILKQAIDIPLTHPKNTQSTRWARLIASLTFDSHLQLSSALTRGTARERQMLFTAEQMDIDLQIKSTREAHTLNGQILGAQRSSAVLSAFVTLQSNTGQLLKATETDLQGQFTFRGISAGIYDLIFDLENQEIAIMGIEVTND